MANLLKSTYIVREEDAKIIDSNDLVAAKIRKYMELHQNDETEELDPDEFTELVNPENVEKLLQEREEPEDSPVFPSVDTEAILQEAREQADEILEKAYKDAEAFTIQAQQKAEKEGYNKGYVKGLDEAEQIKAEAMQMKEQYQKEFEQEMNNLEPKLVDVIAEVFESVFQIQFAEKKEFVLHLLQGALNKIEASKDYVIRVSKEDFPFVTENKNNIQQQLSENAAIEIVEDATLSKNQCLIETDGGVFDCSLDTQLDNLIRDLRTLAGA